MIKVWINGKKMELRTDCIYKFFVRGRKRSVIGVPVGTTVVTAYTLWHGCEAIRVASWYRRHGVWYRADFDKIIPICEIERVEFVEEL